MSGIRPEGLRLPVGDALPALLAALRSHGGAVLAAPPGTGKTTLVPLALAGLTDSGGPVRRVLVAEPRRMAVRAAARRMAWLLGEATGETVGFTVRGERRVSRRTAVEVVTTGVLLQRLGRDPELPGVDAVLLDECHERHLDADTSMAFLLDVRATLRPDLWLLAASATSDTGAWAALMGGVPVVEARDVTHAVEVVWAPPGRPVRPPHGTRVDPALLDHVASVVRRALRERDGDVLCFLPGVGEIARVARLLGDLGDTEVLQLHGRAPAAVQDAALAPGARRRVLLATAVAESSLTVPGVRVVVDAGLAREPRTDHARGLSSLATVPVSRAAADQRAGRAGREGPGTVYRCWSQAQHTRAPRRPSPEIAVADLAAFALDAACWGDPDAAGLALLDRPPAGAMAAARETLRAVDAVAADGRATQRGARMSRLGLHPRLARALLDAAPVVGAARAAEAVALLSEEPPREYGVDLAAAWRTARGGGDGYPARWRAEVRRLRSLADEHVPGAGSPEGLTDDAALGVVVALAFPERVARRRGAGYLMVSGTAAEVGDGPGGGLGGAEWIAVAVADRPASAACARVRSAAVVDEATARTAAASLLSSYDEVAWVDGDVVARSVTRLGAVELASRPLPSPAPEAVRAAVLDGLRRQGPGLLRWSRDAVALRQRMAFLREVLGEPWPEVSDDALLARADEWLGPELATARRRADLERVDAGAALTRLLPWASGEAARFDELAPERITVPSGSRVRVDYEGPQPVLAVKLQELFGLSQSPRIADGRVPLLVHLLSPAGRPAAVTADLASFWASGYQAVRAELRGRYPRHPWPQDPTTARATGRTNTRR
ncbi:ATP-dependent helicase HrpB [Streptomyces sp. ICBB 8177]|uniref:ATP-dependent helicase HrpB n=1 Tax=Streptomyces sp. ICBB 8177 TaxID=563922 RepID=UPI000D684498|nr:ATP-dependent helicase HrpB [Streptomyces sp. ICBB 8177]PWI43483.1 ATP-dependent helicase HrpB [Streptomyces sp. ICBB 8177]